MQVSSVVPIHQSFSSCSGSIEFKEIAAKFEDDFTSKLTLNELQSFNNNQPPPPQEQEDEDDENQDEEEEEEEFSFACTNPDGSPISADDVFLNGQIRPVFPLFNRDLLFSGDETKDHTSFSSSSSSPALRPPLKKLFVKERDHSASSEAEEPEGPCCEWTGKAVETSPEVCKKSNSTGFSKLRRFRELVLRSNSDGKDVFVFLHHHNPNHDNTNNKAEKKEKVAVAEEKKKKKKVAVAKGKRSETASPSSAHERLYVRNRAVKEEHKRKSYLPYRVGFFTNVNGLSRNVHPY